jgi:Trehalase-like, N-terminal
MADPVNSASHGADPTKQEARRSLRMGGLTSPGQVRMTQFGSAEFDDFSPYPPIADYGFLSDCEVTALIAPSGSVEWMCLPRMDDASVFGSMLDRDAGWFRFGPADMAVPADRRYLAGTIVLETVWD